MIVLKSKGDRILYTSLVQFLHDVKIVQGGKALENTLFWHKAIRKYLIAKQKEMINEFESTYFTPDGSVDLEALDLLVDSELDI